VLRIGKTKLIADLSKGTQVSTSKGKLRSLTDVATGDTIEVSGLENTRVHELTTTSRIARIKQPRAKGTPVP
jgi:endonuclease YncB( thermonuclease family)